MSDPKANEELQENTETQPAADMQQPDDAAAEADTQQPDDALPATDTQQTEDEMALADPAVHDDVELGEEAFEQEADSEEKGDPYGGHEPEALKRILEAALFAAGATLSVSHLRDLFEAHERPHGRIVRQSLAELMAGYQGRGVQLVEVASGYRFQTDADTAHWISRLWDEKPQRYSRALMETIALIAYRQPITRGEIEDVRGVAVSSNIIRTLLERDWVRVVGHRDVPGRPAMYATTRQFLDYFGLSALDQLPHLSEIRDLDEINPQMNLEDSNGGQQGDDKETSQSEISFSGMIEKMREAQQDGKTGSEYLDEQLDDELAAMDEVNANFEQALAQQRAEHEHPDLDLDNDSDSENDSDNALQSNVENTSLARQQLSESTEVHEQQPEESMSSADDNSTAEALQNAADSEVSPALSEAEQWKIIQEKLAQQQALLDARESNPSREDDDNE